MLLTIHPPYLYIVMGEDNRREQERVGNRIGGIVPDSD